MQFVPRVKFCSLVVRESNGLLLQQKPVGALHLSTATPRGIAMRVRIRRAVESRQLVTVQSDVNWGLSAL